MTTIQLLNELKTKLESQEMSVLVGSGFSKNVDGDMFPSWSGLLYDLTYELYKREIDSAWEKELERTTPSNTDKKAFHDQMIMAIGESIGYLTLVTMFIERKGIRESITAYIEERIPSISREKGNLYLTLNDCRKELTQGMLSQHRTLVNLPWNNIYTTNYDELLEVAVDNMIREELEKRIEALEEELAENQEEEQTIRMEIAVFLEEIVQPESQEDVETDRLQPLAMSRKRMKPQGDQKESLLKGKQRNLDTVLKRITDTEEDLKALKKGLAKCLTIVKDSSELSLKRNKNIIKLHGSLRPQVNSSYGFDGDSSRQYIVSQDDYLTYPEKHEAFTQLM
ncbi:MAG: hypothetical protein NXH90_04275 [Flavobacteriaceae bacterium]|nr:hypothetical protein [Flavobacteriaceae bacterium]